MGEHVTWVPIAQWYTLEKNGRARMHARGVAAVGNAPSPPAALRGWLQRED